MMFPTHLFTGLLIGSIYSSLFTGMSSSIVFVCAIASVISDIDLFIGQHRKTLHYPVYSGFLFVITIPILLITPIVGVYINGFILCFWIHSIVDSVGGGLGKRPWNSNQNLPTVYNHYSNTWMYKRDVPARMEYDGSPLDLGISVVLAVLIYLMIDTPYLTSILLSVLIIGFIYTVSRKRLVEIEDILLDYPIVSWFIRSLHGSEIETKTKKS